MAVLFKIVSSGASGTSRLSLNGEKLEHYWGAQIISFSSPSHETATEYGGYVNMAWGSIVLSPDVFSSEWIPPENPSITIYYTATNEAAAVILFDGELHLSGYDEESVSYDIYESTYDIDLLSETTDYNGNTVPIPLAIGEVTHVQPLRLPDDDSTYQRPTYHLSGIGTGSNAYAISYFSLTTNGLDVKVGTQATHNFNNDDAITISGTVNFDGNYIVASKETDSFLIKRSIGTTSTTSVNKLVDSTATFISDRVSIGDVVKNTTDGTDTTITIVGSSTELTLTDDIFTSGEGYEVCPAFPTDNSETLPISAAAFTQGSFLVSDDGVPIQEHVLVNGDGTFSLTYGPYGTVTISGTGADTTLTEFMEYVQGELGITSYDDSVARGTSPEISHWATSQATLIDFASELCAFFTHYFYIDSDTLYLGDMLLNNGTDTLDEYDYFTASYSVPNAIKQIKAEWIVHEAVQERLEDGVSSKVYVKDTNKEVVVDGSYTWGDEMDITPYHNTLSNITTALTNIITIMERDRASIAIPIEATLPNPGKKLTFTDTQLISDISTYIWTRQIQYDFINEEVIISGEGVIS